jgi:hypothetical protein
MSIAWALTAAASDDLGTAASDDLDTELRRNGVRTEFFLGTAELLLPAAGCQTPATAICYLLSANGQQKKTKAFLRGDSVTPLLRVQVVSC